jgi:hypothetical protein
MDAAALSVGDASRKSDSSSNGFLQVGVSTSGPPPSVEAPAAPEAELRWLAFPTRLWTLLS